MEEGNEYETLDVAEQISLHSEKPLIRPKPIHLLPPLPIVDHEVKLESPDRSGTPGDQTSRYVALITPATFNLGLKSPNSKKIFAVEIDEKSLAETDVNGIEDGAVIDSFEKKLDGISFNDSEDEHDMSQELEPDSLDDIIINVSECSLSGKGIEMENENKINIVLSQATRESFSDEESETAKKELIVPTIILERVDAEGQIIKYTEPGTENCVSNIQITLSSEDDIQPVVVHVGASLPDRVPKKLFHEEEAQDEDDEPVTTVKDLEAIKLRALERERRRIIDNQVVRRKKIDYWAFANTSPPEFSEDQLIALAHEKGGVQVLAQVETAEEQREATQSPPFTAPPPPPSDTVVKEKDDKTAEENVENETEIEYEVPALRDEDDNEILLSALMTEDGFIGYDEDGMPSLGAVDSASILENKERLRNFWEQRIMADQDLKENGITTPVSPTLVSLDGENKDCTLIKAKSQEDVFKEAAVLEDTEPSPPDSLNEEKLVNGEATKIVNGEIIKPVDGEVKPVNGEVTLVNGEGIVENVIPIEESVLEPAKVLGVDEGDGKEEEILEKELDNSMEESALDQEVRLALEREEELKKEHATTVESSPETSLATDSEEQAEDFPVHHVALAPTVEVESEEEREETSTKIEQLVSTEQIQLREIETNIVQETIITQMEMSRETVEMNGSQETSLGPILISEPFNDEVVTVGEVTFVDTDGIAQPVGEMVQINKPQIIGETLRQHVKEDNSTSLIEIENTTPLTPSTPVTNGVTPSAPTSTTPVKTAVTPLLKNERPTYNPNSDTKIALEIREMKEREEELRIMRETILRETQNNAANKASAGSVSSLSNSSRQSEQGSVHSDEGNETLKLINGQNGISGSSSPVQNQISRAISLDNLHPGQPYNIGYAFGHRRKDGVKVKPMADAEEDKQVFKVLKESPIEKEIRLTKEREEQLKREKGLLQEAVQRPQTLDVTTNGKLSSSKTSPFQVPLKTVSGNGDTQRILATSRIQQEIEEQTEREKALRASGKIQTISQERTDAKVAGSRLREANASPDSAVALSSSGHTPLSPSPSLSDSEKSSTNSTPVITNGNGVYVNGFNAKSPSPTNSTVSAGVKVNGNFQVGRRFSNPPNGRNVNMQRFIASKGKEVTSAFSPFNPASKEKSQSVLSLHHVNGSAIEMKPPKVPKDLKNGTQTNGTSPANGIAKRSLTAENKIQEELKEMQAREDELRQQRARLLGLSQPNLTILDDEVEIDGHHTSVNGDDELPINGSTGSPVLERASSNPNLLDESVEFVGRNKKNSTYGGPRRRSTLIEQWEQRIQSSEAKS